MTWGVSGVLDELGANLEDVLAHDRHGLGGHVATGRTYVLPLKKKVGVGKGLGLAEAVEEAVKVTPGVRLSVRFFGF